MPSVRRLVALALSAAVMLGAGGSASSAAGASRTITGLAGVPGHLDHPRRASDLPVSPLRARSVATHGVTSPRGAIAELRAIARRQNHKRHTGKHHNRKHHKRKHHKKRHKKKKKKPAPTVAARPEPSPITATAAAGGPDWCGQPLEGDDTAHQVFPDQPTIKLIYAYPKDRPDHFSYYAPILQANAAVMMQYVAAQSGGLKTLRFDMGTACGPQYVDIQFLALKGNASHYLDDTGAPVVDPGTPLHDEVAAAVRGEQGHNFVVYADGLNQIYPGDPLWAWGMTDVLIHDARPGTENQNNSPGRIAAVFGPDSGLPPQGPLGFDSTMFLHEALHTLGAVQPGAPHATSGGHCWDGGDVMCYNDGTSGSGNFSYDFCGQVGGEIYQPLDCHKDDYFSPAPPAGSYLASHWNVFDSVFLAPCDDGRVTGACRPS
jgi:hypothetical protein